MPTHGGKHKSLKHLHQTSEPFMTCGTDDGPVGQMWRVVAPNLFKDHGAFTAVVLITGHGGVCEYHPVDSHT